MNDEPKVDTEARIAALEAELAKLKAAAAPPKPFVRQPVESYDWTARASLTPGVLADMVAAVPGGLVASVVGDFRSGPVLPKSEAAGPKSTGSAGWAEPRPLEPPPGVALIDEIADHFDRKDRAKGL